MVTARISEIVPNDVTPSMRACGLEPRDYQARIISKVCNSFLTDYSSVLLESPTGSGKTSMGLVSLKLLKDAIPDITFGWVAMRRKLLQQAEEENERIGVEDIQFVSMFERDPPTCDLIITDEAQHDAASTCAALHEKMGAKWALGLTATPFRTDRIKLSYEKIIRDCGVKFLIEQGYLAPFNQYAIPSWDPLHVADQIAADPQRWGKSVVFFREQWLCHQLQALLSQRGVTSAVMLGSDSHEEREKVFDGFDDGSIQVLINIQLLTEGFDCPDLKTVWVRDSGKLCTMQMAGRVLRKFGDKVAQIVQSAETRWPYPKCVNVKPNRQFIWQDEDWRSIDPSTKVEEVMKKVQDKVLSKPIMLPGYLSGGLRVQSVRMGKDGSVKVLTTRNTNPDSRYLSYEELEEDV